MIASGKRFLDTLNFKPVNTPWDRWGSFIWSEDLEIWGPQAMRGKIWTTMCMGAE